MNANVLRAVDTVYLQAFRQNLLDEVLRARVSLKERARQSASLATAQDLPVAFRQNYGEIAERLDPLIAALRGMLSHIERELHSASHQAGGESAWCSETVETIAALDAAEIDILNALNEMGKSLGVRPPSIVSWDGCARLKTRATLSRITERPCYELDVPIDICSQPFLLAEYFSKPSVGVKPSRWPHYLVNEIMPATLIPLLDGIQVDVQARGQAYVPCRPRERVGG